MAGKAAAYPPMPSSQRRRAAESLHAPVPTLRARCQRGGHREGLVLSTHLNMHWRACAHAFASRAQYMSKGHAPRRAIGVSISRTLNTSFLRKWRTKHGERKTTSDQHAVSNAAQHTTPASTANVVVGHKTPIPTVQISCPKCTATKDVNMDKLWQHENKDRFCPVTCTTRDVKTIIG